MGALNRVFDSTMCEDLKQVWQLTPSEANKNSRYSNEDASNRQEKIKRSCETFPLVTLKLLDFRRDCYRIMVTLWPARFPKTGPRCRSAGDRPGYRNKHNGTPSCFTRGEKTITYPSLIHTNTLKWSLTHRLPTGRFLSGGSRSALVWTMVKLHNRQIETFK